MSDEQLLRVRADRDVCIGAGMCVLTAGAVFDQDDDGVVAVLDETPEDIDAVRRAVANCPSGALSISTGTPAGA
ncbi:ferredoxin [Pseudonocardia bannensis]|uniref:Ferredoxin n=1 Tax=Pseudonocardia bannensis TaxID=630973 RepID=A0A848DHK0_9PSEU|nr:(4Fe-4S)-binding protein [Pseudonocardia bannensis]NMH92029.1 ferredoxin [Pseudonocardia bannensis]